MVNLDIHSIYSTKRSILKLDQIIDFAKKHEQKAIALTDDDGLYGAIYFCNLCKKNGLKPIIGTELNICEDIKIKDKANLRITLLAKNRDGYSNLCKLITRANTEGFYYVPRLDWEILKENCKDLFCLLSGTNNLISGPFLSDQPDYSLFNMRRISNIFLDQFCICVNPFSDKNYLKYIEWVYKNEPVNAVISNSARFLSKDQFKFYDLLRCSGKNEIFSNPNRTKTNPEEYLRTEEEIKEILSPVLDEDTVSSWMDVSNEVADDIDLTFEKKIFFPGIDIGEEKSVESFFKKLLNRKWKEKLPLLKYDTIENYKKRIKYETDTIVKLGYAEYFVIVSDIVSYAKTNDIPVGPGRGSGAGSLVCFILGITTVDPIRYNLIFERFLDPSGKRVSPPDLDIDFSDDKLNGRNKVVEYIINHWGSDKVAVVGNLSTLAFKSSIKDSAKALEIPFETVNAYTKFIPQKVMSLADTQKFNHLKRMLKNDSVFSNLLYLADGIKGSMKTLSTHASGVVVAPDNIVNFTPLQETKDSDVDALTTQLDKDEIESLGLLKIDILGLTALRTIHNTLKLIKNKYDKDIDLDSIDLDDKKIYDLIQKGHTTGLFQLESQGMTDLAQRLKTSSLTEICALIALHRPAVLESKLDEMYVHNKFNEKKKSIHPKIDEITKETYGVLLYQEQVMQASVVMAGFTFSEADLLRKAIGKKLKDDIPILKKKFIDGCAKNKIPPKEATEVFSIFEEAPYIFNKSHSLSYSITTGKTAWLKTYYPVEYMCAYLNSEADDLEKVRRIFDECINFLDIEILPPDINESYNDYSIEYDVGGTGQNKIRYGFSVIKSIGEDALKDILKVRDKVEKFENLRDFVSVIDHNNLSLISGKIETLIKLGVFDSINPNRKSVLNEFLTLSSTYKDIKRKTKNKNRTPLLDINNLSQKKKEEKDFTQSEKRSLEIEYMGISFT